MLSNVPSIFPSQPKYNDFMSSNHNNYIVILSVRFAEFHVKLLLNLKHVPSEVTLVLLGALLRTIITSHTYSLHTYVHIHTSHHRITEHLGSGQFGTVNKGLWHSPMGSLEIAVKMLQSTATEEGRVKFLQEAAIMGQFRHPNVVKLHGVVTVGKPVSLWLQNHNCFLLE